MTDTENDFAAEIEATNAELKKAVRRLTKKGVPLELAFAEMTVFATGGCRELVGSENTAELLRRILAVIYESDELAFMSPRGRA